MSLDRIVDFIKVGFAAVIGFILLRLGKDYVDTKRTEDIHKIKDDETAIDDKYKDITPADLLDIANKRAKSRPDDGTSGKA